MSAATAGLNASEYFGTLWAQGLRGDGVTVAVPDTATSAAFMQGTVEHVLIGEMPSAPEPGHAHADLVLEAIVTIAPAARVIHFPIFHPRCEQRVLLRALEIAVERQADVVNLSLGMPVAMAGVKMHYEDCPVCRAAEAIVTARDGLVVAAVGNWAKEALACPGLAPKVLAVGAAETPDLQAAYALDPKLRTKDFLENLVSTSYAAAFQSAMMVLFRSAFPAIDSQTWRRLLAIGSGHALGDGPNFARPAPTLAWLTRISATKPVNATDWSMMRVWGIATRRALLAVDGDPRVAPLRERAALQATRCARFLEAAEGYAAATRAPNDAAHLSGKIDAYSRAATVFLELDLTVMAAAAHVMRGSALCFRARVQVAGQTQIVLNDVIEAERALSDAATLSEKDSSTMGEALSWRAKADTLRAAALGGTPERAIADAAEAVRILSALPVSDRQKRDLAHAHLHLALAYVFRARAGGSGVPEGCVHAQTALDLAGAMDGYTQDWGRWALGELQV
jgi:hypothetical protein